MVSLVDTRKLNTHLCELNVGILKQISRVSKKLGRADLVQECKKYPKFGCLETMEKEVQVQCFEPSLPDVSPIKPQRLHVLDPFDIGAGGPIGGVPP